MNWKSNILFAIAVMLAPFVLLVALFVGTILWHNCQLAALQSRVATLAHPRGTMFLARHGDIGNAGNGHHLDFWAVELRSRTSPKTQLQSSYQDLRVAVPNDEDDDSSDVENGTQPVEVEILPSPLPAHYQVECGNIAS